MSVRLHASDQAAGRLYRDSATGTYLVPTEHVVEGSKVIVATALQGYALTEYRDGNEEEGIDLPWVDNYIAHFKQIIEPYKYPNAPRGQCGRTQSDCL